MLQRALDFFFVDYPDNYYQFEKPDTKLRFNRQREPNASIRFLDKKKENMKNPKINYLPTIPKSPEYPVCETYLDFLVGTMKVLELI